MIAELSYDRDGIIHVVVEQKGFQNRREVTMAVRAVTAAADDEGLPELDEEVVNYMVQKARRLASFPGLATELQERLEQAVDAYGAALRDEAAEIDDLEDALLELMDEAEEQGAGA
jgi:molecular chaperone DnaK